MLIRSLLVWISCLCIRAQSPSHPFSLALDRLVKGLEQTRQQERDLRQLQGSYIQPPPQPQYYTAPPLDNYNQPQPIEPPRDQYPESQPVQQQQTYDQAPAAVPVLPYGMKASMSMNDMAQSKGTYPFLPARYSGPYSVGSLSLAVQQGPSGPPVYPDPYLAQQNQQLPNFNYGNYQNGNPSTYGGVPTPSPYQPQPAYPTPGNIYNSYPTTAPIETTPYVTNPTVTTETTSFVSSTPADEVTTPIQPETSTPDSTTTRTRPTQSDQPPQTPPVTSPTIAPTTTDAIVTPSTTTRRTTAGTTNTPQNTTPSTSTRSATTQQVTTPRTTRRSTTPRARTTTRSTTTRRATTPRTTTRRTTTRRTTTPRTTRSTTPRTMPTTPSRTTPSTRTTTSTTIRTNPTTTRRTITTTLRPRPPPITDSTVPPPNRIRGKPHVICENDGIVFRADMYFPFSGVVFARDRESEPECYKEFGGFDGTVEVAFNYEKCGRPSPGGTPGLVNYIVEVIVRYDPINGEAFIQSFMAQCQNQRVVYEKDDLPRRIEEALEELNIVPIKIERRAPMPDCVMRIVPEDEGDVHSYGPSDKKPVTDAQIGQKLKIEWSLVPETEAFGFLVRNCTVQDRISGISHVVIDDNGCSTDLNILGHPHYDVYHDLAIVHWHAFKVPDNAQLSFTCDFDICTDIPDENGISNCKEIPTPPYCPNLVSAPPNQLVFDFNTNFLAKRTMDKAEGQLMDVQVDVCVRNEDDTEQNVAPKCAAEKQSRQPFVVENGNSSLPTRRLEFGRNGPVAHYRSRRSVCMSLLLFAAILSFTILCFTLSAGIFFGSIILPHVRRFLKSRNQTVFSVSESSSASNDSAIDTMDDNRSNYSLSLRSIDDPEPSLVGRPPTARSHYTLEAPTTEKRFISVSSLQSVTC